MNKTEHKTPFQMLALFFIILLLIPQSNCYIERQLSQVGLIKPDKCNLLSVDTMPSILKVRSSYEDKVEKQNFEPQD